VVVTDLGWPVLQLEGAKGEWTGDWTMVEGRRGNLDQRGLYREPWQSTRGKRDGGGFGTIN